MAPGRPQQGFPPTREGDLDELGSARSPFWHLPRPPSSAINGRLSVCMEAGFGGQQGEKKRVHTFLHQSRWLRAMLSAISRMSATFWRWKRSRSAWIVELEYFRSCADKCSASSSYSIARLKGPSGGDATEHVHTCEIDSRVLLIPFRRAVSGSTSIIPCNV